MTTDVEVGQSYERQKGPPLIAHVVDLDDGHDGIVSCRMSLNGRSFGARPVPADLLTNPELFKLVTLEPHAH